LVPLALSLLSFMVCRLLLIPAPGGTFPDDVGGIRVSFSLMISAGMEESYFSSAIILHIPSPRGVLHDNQP
jgi:hypothetical protein